MDMRRPVLPTLEIVIPRLVTAKSIVVMQSVQVTTLGEVRARAIERGSAYPKSSSG